MLKESVMLLHVLTVVEACRSWPAQVADADDDEVAVVPVDEVDVWEVVADPTYRVCDEVVNDEPREQFV